MLTSQKGRAKARLFFIHLSLVVGLLSCPSCSNADVTKNDMVRYGLNTRVRSYRVVQELCRNTCPDSNFEVYFNDNARVDSLVYLFADGTPRVREIYEYNHKGQLERISTFDMGGRDSGIYCYEYDGAFTSSCILFGINNDEISRWNHSNDGKEIVRTEYFEDGVLQTDTHSTYDGNFRQDEVFDADGTLILRSSYEYYDLSEKLPLSIQSDDLHITLDYNSFGYPISCRGALVDAVGGFYLDNSEDDETSVRYEYELDGCGNWIKRFAFLGDSKEPSEIVVRELRY